MANILIIHPISILVKGVDSDAFLVCGHLRRYLRVSLKHLIKGVNSLQAPIMK